MLLILSTDIHNAIRSTKTKTIVCCFYDFYAQLIHFSCMHCATVCEVRTCPSAQFYYSSLNLIDLGKNAQIDSQGQKQNKTKEVSSRIKT